MIGKIPPMIPKIEKIIPVIKIPFALNFLILITERIKPPIPKTIAINGIAKRSIANMSENAPYFPGPPRSNIATTIGIKAITKLRYPDISNFGLSSIMSISIHFLNHYRKLPEKSNLFRYINVNIDKRKIQSNFS